MRSIARIRKPVTSLTAEDFTACAVWEYAIDEEGVPGQDETWVRPTARARLTRGLYSQLVRASFRTSRGDIVPGFVVVTTAGAKPEVELGALLLPRYLPLPTMSREKAVARRAEWVLRLRRHILLALRRREDGVFPLSYRLEVPLGREGKLLRGRVR